MSKYEAGLVTINDADKGVIETATRQCVHCGAHWVHIVGSKIVRGWCGPCGGFVCSAKCLKKCVPIEAQLDNVEAGRPVNHRKITTAGKLWIPPGAERSE